MNQSLSIVSTPVYLLSAVSCASMCNVFQCVVFIKTMAPNTIKVGTVNILHIGTGFDRRTKEKLFLAKHPIALF